MPPRIRGGVVYFNQLMITLGILGAYIVDWGFAGLLEQLALDVRRSAVIPGVILAIGMYFMPFSPRWLVEQRPRGRRTERARRYRDSDEARR